MADADEEDLFADLYENDDAAPSKDQIGVTSQPAGQDDIKPEPSGYGEEPDATQDNTSYDAEPVSMQTESNGYNGDDFAPHGNEISMMVEEPGIRMKEDGKMFIGGLNWETTDQSLHDYFSQFGEVHECTVMRDGATGRSRGFGFLTFKDPKTVNTVMVKEHFLDGKIIDPKRAIPKDEQEKTAKIFVGGVSQDATEADFTDFFAQFGRVIDATLMMDKDTGRPRGFGFVTFDNDLAVERCLEFRPLEILNKPIEVKRAQPRGKMGEEEDFRGGRGRGKFGRDDRFSDNQNQAQGQGPAVQGMNGMSPQMMAQYWQRMQQYFQVMQQQMMANAMGGMGQMNPQMMAQMQQMQRMQGGNSPGGMGNMNPQQMQQMQQQMMMQMQAGGGMNGMGAQQGQGGQAGGAGRGSFTPQQQNSFEQQKYEQLARKGGGAPSGPRSGSRSGSQGPQSWEGMYDDVPQPDGGQGGRGSGTPKAAPAQPSNAPANAPTGPKNPGKPPGGGGFRGGGGGGFRGGRGGGGRYHPYGR